MEKVIGGIVAVIALIVGGMWLFSVAPTAGEEAVLIDRPLFFGHGGVVKKAIGTGRSYIAPTTSVVYVSIQPKQYAAHFKDMMSADGVPLEFDAYIRLLVTESVPLVENYGPEWYKNNVEVVFMNAVRQAVRKHGMNEMAISTSAVDQVGAEVNGVMDTYLKATAIPVKLIDVTFGKINPPDSVRSQRVQTAEQQQRKQTEIERTEAEKARAKSEAARAVADQAYNTGMGLTPDLYVKLEQIRMQREVCSHGGCTFILGGEPSPVLNLNRQTEKAKQ